MDVYVVVECPIILAKCINNGSEGQFINHGDPLDAVSNYYSRFYTFPWTIVVSYITSYSQEKVCMIIICM